MAKISISGLQECKSGALCSPGLPAPATLRICRRHRSDPNFDFRAPKMQIWGTLIPKVAGPGNLKYMQYVGSEVAQIPISGLQGVSRGRGPGATPETTTATVQYAPLGSSSGMDGVQWAAAFGAEVAQISISRLQERKSGALWFLRLPAPQPYK